MANNDRLNVSLEPHLLERLTPLIEMLPPELSNELGVLLSSSKTGLSTPIIPYDLVLEISKWSRSSTGTKALQSCSPPLDPHSYTTISLLAGTRTSPEKHFPPYIAPDPEEERRRAVDDRKAISTVVNAVLSVAGTSVATWWASDYTGLRIEWRALLAVGAALVVAFAEIVLYMIWDSRPAAKPRETSRRRRVLMKREKDEGEGAKEVSVQASSTGLRDSSLHHRTPNRTEPGDDQLNSL